MLDEFEEAPHGRALACLLSRCGAAPIIGLATDANDPLSDIVPKYLLAGE